LMLRPILLV